MKPGPHSTGKVMDIFEHVFTGFSFLRLPGQRRGKNYIHLRRYKANSSLIWEISCLHLTSTIKLKFTIHQGNDRLKFFTFIFPVCRP